ncbi:hypothetical protein FN846DRAFT_780244 [Sphaerosporella brunnea]|uniref:Uncharacterized protein n=1 Tax=Sphaerosporella brunnea TaxID=1250544 RepID=A0A5J5EU00_9PEZI|nr:hypothetical protein FN846DRAFT_780244 [Sphaerosporella brunnea]
MCSKTTCGKCSGATWFGCGSHIPSVMDSIPKEQWCKCPRKGNDQYPPMGSSPSCIIL